MVTNQELQSASNLLERRLGVTTLWLFGSEAAGTAGPGSDLDFAAIFERPPDKQLLIDVQDQLSSALQRPIDLVDLERASPALGMQVLRHGRLLLDRDPARRARLVAALPGRYEDLRIVRAPIERRISERMNGRT